MSCRELTQCTKARLEYKRSNLLSSRAQAVAILFVDKHGSCDTISATHEVVFDSMHKDRETLAKSPPGTKAGGSLQMPSYEEFSASVGKMEKHTLKPVGHQSTNWIVLLVRTLLTAALTSLGTTSPRNRRQHAMYLPCLGSHLTIWLLLSKQEMVISDTELDSWNAVGQPCSS